MAETVKESKSTTKPKTTATRKGNAKLNGNAEPESTAHLNGAAALMNGAIEINGSGDPKTAAKRRKAADGKAAVVEMAPPGPAWREQVAQLAHRYWAERGFRHGHHEEDWFRAEQELRAKAS